MDISGLVQTFGSRATSSAALTHNIMAPHYIQSHSYSGPTQNNTVAAPQQPQHNPFMYNAYSGAPANRAVPTFAMNYIQPQPLPRLAQQDIDTGRGVPFSRSVPEDFIKKQHSQSPVIKPEPLWSSPVNTSAFITSNTKTITSAAPINGSSDMNFGTEVDTLMKAIQAKSQMPKAKTGPSYDHNNAVAGVSQSTLYAQTASQDGTYVRGEEMRPRLKQEVNQDDGSRAKHSKKRYQCKIQNCTKSFYQKTHLDIHERAHTGAKPYVNNHNHLESIRVY